MKSDFNKAEWMEESGVHSGTEWKTLVGKPSTEFCDIRLKNGREIGPCWPMVKTFVDLAHEDIVYPFSDVSHIRYYKNEAPADDFDGDSDSDEDEDEDEDEENGVEKVETDSDVGEEE